MTESEDINEDLERHLRNTPVTTTAYELCRVLRTLTSCDCQVCADDFERIRGALAEVVDSIEPIQSDRLARHVERCVQSRARNMEAIARAQKRAKNMHRWLRAIQGS